MIMKKIDRSIRAFIPRPVVAIILTVCTITASAPGLSITAAASEGAYDTDESTFSPLERAIYCDTLEFLNRIYNTDTTGSVSTEYICSLPHDCAIKGDTYKDIYDQIRAARDRVFDRIRRNYPYLCGWTYPSANGTFLIIHGIDPDDHNECSHILFR